MKKWKCKKSELILDSKYMKIRKDTVELPNGEVRERTYWDSNDSAMVIGMLNGKLVMIRQYRYLVDDEVLEFPSGSLNDGESAEQGAKREFEEETGYKCDSLIEFGSFYETYGQLNRRMHLFFSKDISISRQKLDRDERGHEEIGVELINIDEVVDLALKNKIVAMGSALAILLLKEKIDRKEIVVR